MKRLLILMLALFAFTVIAPAEEVKSELAETMSQIKSSIEELKQNVKQDDVRESNLAQVERLITAAEKASQLDPTAARGLDEAAREKFLDRYRAAMKALVSDAQTLREMIEDGAEPDARYQQMMKIYQHQQSGHERFQEEKPQ